MTNEIMTEALCAATAGTASGRASSRQGIAVSHVTGMLFLAAVTVSASAMAADALSSAAANCRALASIDFSGIRDAPTAVMDAQVVETNGDTTAHCHVQGYIAPQIGFELKMPTSNWNSKFVEVNCGGSGGTTRSRLCMAWCSDVLSRGYACIVSDQGHHMTSEERTQKNGLWAYNNLQAEIDSGFRAGHVVALAGKAIAERYYAVRPKFSYFMGCSYGGRQALVQAQRFPWDFDGIIAMEPAIRFTGQSMAQTWNTLAVLNPDGTPRFRDADIELLRAAVLARCDVDDGISDGLIGDPRTCKFDPGQLLCKGKEKSGCLSEGQVAAARKVYGGPVTSTGESTFIGHTMLGAENGSFAFQGDLVRANSLFANMVFMPDPGPGWKATDFDFDQDHKRLDMMETLYASDNPDLRKFKARSGKLIVAQGWHDSGSPLPLSTLDYYETVERTMGGRAATQDFARLFMIPGRAHCGGGPGASAVDFLGHLEAWVEQGRAPDMMVGYHVESEDRGDYIRTPKDPGMVKFTRPHYPYPLQARYKGTGDPNDYRSFAPIESPGQ